MLNLEHSAKSNGNVIRYDFKRNQKYKIYHTNELNPHKRKRFTDVKEYAKYST